MLFFGVGGSGRRPVESADPGGGPAWGCQDRNVLSGNLFSLQQINGNRGAGAGGERAHNSHRRVSTFRGYMQSKSMSGLWEAHKASDGVSDALSEVPGSMVGSH